MITYLKHSEINKKKWDDCISKSRNGLIYAYSWYLDIAAPGWDALQEDNYSYVMPLTWKKKYTLSYIYPPYFIQQLGLFSEKEIALQDVQRFADAIPTQFRFIEYNLNWKNNFPPVNFSAKKNLTHHLGLNSDYENLYAEYSQNLKRNLKKATSSNLEIIKNVDPSSLVKMFRENRGAAISNLKEENYKTLLRLVGEASKRNAVEIPGVKKDSRLCAGAIFFKSNNKFIFLFSATNPVAKEIHAMPFLIDYFIRENSESADMLDFEGSNNPELARFYKGFGAVPVTYLQIKRNNLSLPLKWIKK